MKTYCPVGENAALISVEDVFLSLKLRKTSPVEALRILATSATVSVVSKRSPVGETTAVSSYHEKFRTTSPVESFHKVQWYSSLMEAEKEVVRMLPPASAGG